MKLHYRSHGWRHLPSSVWASQIGSLDIILTELVRRYQAGDTSLYQVVRERISVLGGDPWIAEYLYI